MTKKIVLISTVCLLSFFSANSFAINGKLTAKVVSTSVTSSAFGVCMAKLNKKINTATNSPACPGQWVTFSCDGAYNSKDIAYHKLDIAQKSEVTQDSIEVYITDTKKKNGICFATRVDSKRAVIK